MEQYIRKTGMYSILTTVLLLIVGFLMISQPIVLADSFMFVFGVILILDGAIHSLSYFSIQDEYRYYSYEFAQSIIGMVLGFIVVANYHDILLILPILLGIWIILDGLFKLQIALNIRGIRNIRWGIMLLLSLITIALGIGIIFNPASTVEMTVRLSGAIIIITQLMAFYDSFYILLQVKDLKKKEKAREKAKVKSK